MSYASTNKLVPDEIWSSAAVPSVTMSTTRLEIKSDQDASPFPLDTVSLMNDNNFCISNCSKIVDDLHIHIHNLFKTSMETYTGTEYVQVADIDKFSNISGCSNIPVSGYSCHWYSVNSKLF